MNASAPAPDLTKIPSTQLRYGGIYKAKILQRVDPERLGRLRVMVEGIYKDIAVQDLPWAWPCTKAHKKGGLFMIPPMDEYVWVMFEAGMADYPVWLGGWWGAPSAGKVETSDGKDESAHVDLPTNNFGGESWAGGLLKLEPIDGIRPEDAPNNVTLSSPLQKYFELDDRKTLEKIKIADQLDNYFWINTQKGRSTWELIQGIEDNVKARKYRGITFNNLDEVIQTYTFKGWLITVDDKQGFLELTSPQKFKVKLDETNKRLELWTAQKNYLVLDDAAQKVDLRTAAGRTLAMDDTAKMMRYSGAGELNYLMIDENTNTVELRSSGDLKLKSGHDLSLSATGKINLDAAQILLNCGTVNVTKTLTALTAYTQPENAALTRKADFEQRGRIPQ